ncbi:MAG: hypothetical protein JOY99_14385 [Sphingomonadaceae bacterium]|nr:hypothetical protein [Sphingomonadaceae bacterium]
MMRFLIAFTIALGAALFVPLSVRDNPDTFNGMLRGSVWQVPYTYTVLHVAWPVLIGVFLLMWVLLKVAGR